MITRRRKLRCLKQNQNAPRPSEQVFKRKIRTAVFTGDPEAVQFASFFWEVWTSYEKFEKYFLVRIDLCLHKNNMWNPRERCRPIMVNLPENVPCPHRPSVTSTWREGAGSAARLFHLFLFYVPCSANHENMAEVFLGDTVAFPYCSQAFLWKFGQVMKSL